MAKMHHSAKLTETQRADIFRRALNGERTCDLAEEYGVCTDTIQSVKYDPKRLERAEQKLSARQQFSRLRIRMGAEKGLEKEHEILDRPVPNGKEGVSLLYLQHQAAISFMDRDGLRAPEKVESTHEIVFSSGGVDLGMPSANAADTAELEDEDL